MSKLINIVFKNNNNVKKILYNIKSNKINNNLTILDIARKNNVDIEASCDASLACSTCHIILEKKIYNLLKEPCDDELDMLELAPDLTETSRLSCQVQLNDIIETLINNNKINEINKFDEINIIIPSFNKNSKYE